jgi:hypothetical protein
MRLGDGLHGRADDDLVGHLGDLAVAVALADVGDRRAHACQQRPHALQRRRRAADHDRQFSRRRPSRPAGDRRVEVVPARLVDAPGEVDRRRRRDAAHVDHRRPGPQSLDDAVGAEEHAVDIGRVGQHEDHRVAGDGDIAARRQNGGARLDDVRRRRRIEFDDDEVAAGGLQPSSHRRSHRAQSDEADLRSFACHAVSLRVLPRGRRRVVLRWRTR